MYVLKTQSSSFFLCLVDPFTPSRDITPPQVKCLDLISSRRFKKNKIKRYNVQYRLYSKYESNIFSFKNHLSSLYTPLCNIYFSAAWGATTLPIPNTQSRYWHDLRADKVFTTKTAAEHISNHLPYLLSPGCFRPLWNSRTSADESWWPWTTETEAHKSGAIS